MPKTNRCYTPPHVDGYNNEGYYHGKQGSRALKYNYTEPEKEEEKEGWGEFYFLRVLQVPKLIRTGIAVGYGETSESALEKKFNELASKWKKETGGYSTMLLKAGNNNYLDIIGMGMDVVPFILRDLEKDSSLWFSALKAITKENPVPREHLGNTEKMRADWIKWGRDKKLI